jgi:protein arginine kinase
MLKTDIINNSAIYAPVILSKIYIIRNLENYPFSLTCTQEKKDEIEEKVIDYLSLNYKDIRISDYKNKAHKFDIIDEMLLGKNNKIGKIINFEKREISLVLNTNDHINIIVSDNNFNIEESYKKAEDIENQLASKFNFAASTKYGFLTSYIKNCGLGVKIAVLINLSGVVSLKKQNSLFTKFYEKGYDIKPLDQYKFDENETSYFIISTALNFGLSENDLIEKFICDINELLNTNHSYIVEYSLKNKDEFVDNIFRSYGILKYARLIDIQEAVYHLSNIRMGINIGEDIPVSIETLNNIFVLLHEDYINSLVEKEKKPSDAIIAKIIRSHLNMENTHVS